MSLLYGILKCPQHKQALHAKPELKQSYEEILIEIIMKHLKKVEAEGLSWEALS